MKYLMESDVLKYAWTITTRLKVEGGYVLGEKDVPVVGPHEAMVSPSLIMADERAQRFRLLDDDGHAYCEGYLVDLAADRKCSGFEPLDDYGRGALGCTSIQYWECGKWVTL